MPDCARIQDVVGSRRSEFHADFTTVYLSENPIRDRKAVTMGAQTKPTSFCH
jgi:hypothetical protein